MQLLRPVTRQLVHNLFAGPARQRGEPVDHQIADQHASDQLTAQDRDR